LSGLLHVGSLVDVEQVLRQDSRFSTYRVLRSDGEVLEIVEGEQGAALLALPTVWRSRQRRAEALAMCDHSDTLLICIGRGEGDLERLSSLVGSSRVSCLLLPQPVAGVAASLGNSMSLYRAQRQAQQRGEAAERYRYEIGELISIGASLNSERDIGRLLEMILSKARFITGADAGSVYIVNTAPPHEAASSEPPRRVLRFEVAQNDSVEVDFRAFTLDISPTSIVGAAVLGAEAINIPDLYRLDQHNPWGVVHNRSFDERTGYRTHSALTVPMINARDDVIGVIQLINKRVGQAPLLREQDFAERVRPFDPRSVDLCKTLAYQAAVALDNALLYDELRRVFEGFVEASVGAIEARDPTTSGHSRRVADLTVGLAKATEREPPKPYAGLSFDADQLKEIEYAGLLHDFGKVGVPENVLLKADKLHRWDYELIIARFDYIALWLDGLRHQAELAALRGELPSAQLSAELARVDGERSFLQVARETVDRANRPTVLESEEEARLVEVAQRRYRDPRGEEQPYLRPDELACLRVRRGSLNEEERRQIESHVVHTFNFLCAIPWGRAFASIPRIAGDHHEKLDGSGYPSGKPASTIPVQAKMMAVSDIFDALTASDRPYKKAMPVPRALSILEDEVSRGKLDPHLLGVFIEAEVFRKVL
jgi:HD-GYP domain-containing protein (c-di-GMP phosphodiesterase class II)